MVSPVIIMLVILVVNGCILLVNNAEFFNFKVEPLQEGTFGLNETSVQEYINETQTDVSSINPIYVFGDFIKGLTQYINLTAVLLFGLPLLMAKMGVPSEIVDVVFAIVGFNYLLAAVEFISGRRVRE